MKKIYKYFVLISIVLICALLNVIVFLTVDKARLDTAAFWLAWAFATPWNLAMAIVLHLWSSKNDQDVVIKMPATYYICALFGALYLILGAIFMYLNVEKITLLLILELIVTVAYLIMALYVYLAGNYIVDSENETAQQIFFMRTIQSNVTSCLPMVNDPKVKAALEELSEKIRYSDPMSHPSLAAVENELAVTIDEIASKLTTGDKDVSALEDVIALIKKAEIQLARRNSQCLTLK